MAARGWLGGLAALNAELDRALGDREEGAAERQDPAAVRAGPFREQDEVAAEIEYARRLRPHHEVAHGRIVDVAADEQPANRSLHLRQLGEQLLVHARQL